VTNALVVWMVLAEAMEHMVQAGKIPLVFQSLQMNGAKERNALLDAEFKRTAWPTVLNRPFAPCGRKTNAHKKGWAG